MTARVGVIETQLEPLKEGIKNFRDFQTRGTRYFDRAEAVLDSNESRRRRHMQWLGIIALFLVPLSVFLCYHWYVFTQDMIQIDNEWRQSHEGHRNSYFAPPNVAPPLDSKIQNTN